MDLSNCLWFHFWREYKHLERAAAPHGYPETISYLMRQVGAKNLRSLPRGSCTVSPNDISTFT